mgnify:CR=1 FL=1
MIKKKQKGFEIVDKEHRQYKTAHNDTDFSMIHWEYPKIELPKQIDGCYIYKFMQPKDAIIKPFSFNII